MYTSKDFLTYLEPGDELRVNPDYELNPNSFLLPYKKRNKKLIFKRYTKDDFGGTRIVVEDIPPRASYTDRNILPTEITIAKMLKRKNKTKNQEKEKPYSRGPLSSSWNLSDLFNYKSHEWQKIFISKFFMDFIYVNNISIYQDKYLKNKIPLNLEVIMNRRRMYFHIADKHSELMDSFINQSAESRENIDKKIEKIISARKGEKLTSLSAEKETKGEAMNLNHVTHDAEDFPNRDKVVSKENAVKYAAQIAQIAVNNYIDSQGSSPTESSITTKGTNVKKDLLNGVEDVAGAVVSETALNAKMIAGERLYENIETAVDKFILSRLNWWQKLSLSTKNKKLATLIGTYVVIHAIKSGGFGLTKYRINHAALDYVTIACNREIQKQIFGGFDTNIVSELMKSPEVVTGE